MKKFLVFLIIIALIVLGGAKLWMWYSLDQYIDSHLTKSPYSSNVTYEKALVRFNGEVGIEGIVISSPNEFIERIEIDEVVISFPDFFSLITLRNDFESGKVPDSLVMAVRGLQVFPDYVRLDSLTENTPGNEGVKAYVRNWDTFGCQTGFNSGLTDLRLMGYPSFIYDIEIGYKLDRTEDEMNEWISMRLRDMASVDLGVSYGFSVSGDLRALEFLRRNSEVFGIAGEKLDAELNYIELDLKDIELNKRRTKFCLSQYGMDGAMLALRDIDLAKNMLAEDGITFGKSVEQAISDYVTMDGARARVKIDPGRTVRLSELQFYKPQDVLQLLGVDVMVNGMKLRELDIDWRGKPEIVDNSNESNVKNNTVPDEQDKEEARAERRTLMYRATSVRDLDEYVGKKAKIKSRDGRIYKGRLASVTSEAVTVEVWMHGGAVSYPVDRKNIVSASVYR